MNESTISTFGQHSGRDLLDNVLIVRKTPKYERLKDTESIKHPYIQDILIKNW